MPLSASRRRFLCATAVAPLAPFIDAVVKRASAADVLPPGLDAAIDRGLQFLHGQQKDDGSFDAIGPAPAMGALALLAFLASGHTPDLGKFGPRIRKTVDYLLTLNPAGGYFGKDNGNMYAHAIVTAALAEVHGTEADEAQRRRVRTALGRCLNVIYDAQDAQKDRQSYRGGWRYQPNATDSDLSVSGWCMVALRACQNAGFRVPKERADRALAFLLQCHRPEQRGFAYLPGQDASPSMTGLAVLCLHLLDAADRIDMRGPARFLTDRPVKDGDRYFYHGHYHTTQGAFQLGGKTWDAVWKNATTQLLPMQEPSGAWPKREDPGDNAGRPGRFYSTCMACLTLSVPLQLLPMYQK